MKNFVKIIALMLCVLMIVPMLFACSKEEVAEETAASGDADNSLPEIEIPNFKYIAKSVVTIDGETSEELQEISFYNGNIHFDMLDGFTYRLGGEKLSFTLCDNIAYVKYGEHKYKLDLGELNVSNIISQFFAEEPAVDVDGITPNGDTATAMSTTGADDDSILAMLFNSSTTGTDENGNTVTTYIGLNPKIVSLIEYFIEESGSTSEDEVFFDKIQFSVSKSSDGNFAGAAYTVTGTTMLYNEETDTSYKADASAKASVSIAYGEAAKVTAPEDADSYENALPLIINMASDYFKQMLFVNMAAFERNAERAGYRVVFFDDTTIDLLYEEYGVIDCIVIEDGEKSLGIYEFSSPAIIDDFFESQDPPMEGEVVGRFVFMGDLGIMDDILAD